MRNIFAKRVTTIRELVRKAQKGNQEAYIQLFAQYEADLYRIAFVYVRNEQDALDVVQETAYRSFKSIGGLKKPDYFKTWLIRITISSSLDLLRLRKKVISLSQSPIERGSSASRSTDENVVLSLSLQQIIDTLDEDEKSVIIVRFYQDCTIREASEILGIPLGTAKTTLYRALNKLRHLVKEEEYYD